MNNLKYNIAWPTARLFFFIGDAIARFLDKYIEIIEEEFFIDQCEDNNVFILHDIYSWFLIKSSDIDAWGDTKLWSNPVPP